MSAIVGGRKITDLTAKTSPSDSDLMAVGDSGTAALRKVTLSNLANWIKTKVEDFTYSLNCGTSAMSLISAINNITQGTGTINYVCNCGGYLTTNKTSIGITIPTNRVIRNRTISVVTLKGLQVRQNGNTIYNQTGASADFSDMTATATLGNCGLNLTLTKSSAFPDSTNNDAVGIYVSVDITWT